LTWIKKSASRPDAVAPDAVDPDQHFCTVMV